MGRGQGGGGRGGRGGGGAGTIASQITSLETRFQDIARDVNAFNGLSSRERARLSPTERARIESLGAEARNNVTLRRQLRADLVRRGFDVGPDGRPQRISRSQQLMLQNFFGLS